MNGLIDNGTDLIPQEYTLLFNKEWFTNKWNEWISQ